MTSRARRATRVAAASIGVFVAACNPGPTTVQLPPLEMVIASGDGQFGVVGEELSAPLRVVVRSDVTGSPREDLSVLWDVVKGAATIVPVTTTLTDSTGSTETRLRLGTTPGEVSVRASVAGQGGVSTTFQLFAVNPPSLSAVTPSPAAAGETVTLTGTDFSTLAEQNVVLFSGIRGRVVAATQTSLQVEVPACLPARDVDVTVQLGVVPGTTSVPLTISGGGQVTSMGVGDVLDVADDGGFTCHALAGEVVGADYLMLAYSASAVGAAQHPFEVTVLSSSGPSPGAARGPRPVRTPYAGERATGLQEAWDQRLRALEDDLGRGGAESPRGSAGPARVGPARVPSVGERRTFNVLNSSGEFDQVTAEARYVGMRAAIFVDDDAPPDGLEEADLAGLSARFDNVIHPVVTGAFGSTSDLDANERVIILFTPAVNRLTPRGSSGFIGGYFYGVDLLPTNTGSNQGEIFYALVPDPDGIFSDDHTKEQVLEAVPAVLAHEFQHMVHFNERVLVRGAAGQEALWLSEGLAQMAEELAARAYDAVFDTESAGLFRAGAVQRARRYLVGPDTVSVVVTTGQGSLPERGAGFLSLLYLEDQFGTGLLGDLTRTTRTGVANVEHATGMSWPDVLADWWSATYLDGPGPEAGPLTYPTIDLRAYLGGSFPLQPEPIGPGDASDSGSLWSSSVRYYIVSPPIGGSVSIRLGGDAGGPSAVQAALRLRLIRIS